MASSRAGGNPAMTEATDTFQFTFSVPVPKSNISNYHAHHRPEPSSDNSTPDSGSSQLLFSLNRDNIDGEGSEESDVGDDEDDQPVKSPPIPAENIVHERVISTYRSHAPVEQPVIRRLRSRAVLATEESASNHKQESKFVLHENTAPELSKSRKRKITAEAPDTHSNTAATTSQHETRKNKMMNRMQPKNIPRDRKSQRSDASHIFGNIDDLDLHSNDSKKLTSQANYDTGSKQTHVEDSIDEQACLQFRSGYDYFGVSDPEEDEDHGYHGADEQEGIGHILDAADALKMMKQRRQDRKGQMKQVPSKPSEIKPNPKKPCPEPPASPVPIRKNQPGIIIPTSKSQEDFVYVDSDCIEPPTRKKLPNDDNDGRKLVYVFRGQKYETDVDLTDIPWAAGDSDDDDDLQQIRFKPRVLWADHPQDVNARIKLKDTQANK